MLCEGDSDGGSSELDGAGMGASLTGAASAGGGLELVVAVISAILCR